MATTRTMTTKKSEEERRREKDMFSTVFRGPVTLWMMRENLALKKKDQKSKKSLYEYHIKLSCYCY